MKKLITLVLAFSTLSSPGFAETCRRSNCKIAGGSAAGAMVAGAVAIRGRIKSKDLEAKYLVQLFSGNGNAESALAKIIDGDRVMVQHTLNKQANLNFHIEKLESDISSAETNAQTHRNNAITAALPKTESVYENGQFKGTRMVPGDAGQALMYNSLASQADDEARSISRELARVHAGKATIPVYKFDKILKNASSHLVGDHLQHLSSNGSKVVYMNRLPGNIARKVSSATRNGWILAATAVTLGLVTTEELLAGKIARKLDGETRQIMN